MAEDSNTAVAELDQAMADQVKFNGAVATGHNPNEPLPELEAKKKPVVDALKPKVDAPKPEEGAPTPKPGDVPAVTDEDQKKQSRWMELKAAEKERNELKEWRTKEEKRIKDLEARQWKEDERKELEELRLERKARAVEQTPEWNQQIAVPFQQRQGYVERAAKHYGIDSDRLWSAMDTEDSFVRNEKIEELIASTNEARIAKDEKPIPSNISSDLATVGNQLQVIYAEMARKRAEALELDKSLTTQKSQMTEKAQAEQKSEYETQHKEVRTTLEKQLPALFGNKELPAIEGVSLSDAVDNATPAQDSRGQAYQAQAGEIMPYMTHRLIALEAENKTLKEEAAARAAANPRLQQTTVNLPTEKSRGEYKTLDEAMVAQARFDHRQA